MQNDEEQRFMQRSEDMECQVLFLLNREIPRLLHYFSLINVELLKLFLAGDAYHITQPQGDGRGAILAMTRALEQVEYLFH